MPSSTGFSPSWGHATPPFLSSAAAGAVSPDQVLNEYLLTAAGSKDMTVNGAVTAVPFLYTVPAKKVVLLERVLIYYDSASAFDASEFGHITALANGVTIVAGGALLDTWNDNADLATTMHDVPGNENFAKKDKSLAGRWTLTKATKYPIKLVAGETFVATVNDDLTGLVVFRVKIQGCLCDV